MTLPLLMLVVVLLTALASIAFTHYLSKLP